MTSVLWEQPSSCTWFVETLCIYLACPVYQGFKLFLWVSRIYWFLDKFKHGYLDTKINGHIHLWCVLYIKGFKYLRVLIYGYIYIQICLNLDICIWIDNYFWCFKYLCVSKKNIWINRYIWLCIYDHVDIWIYIFLWCILYSVVSIIWGFSHIHIYK